MSVEQSRSKPDQVPIGQLHTMSGQWRTIYAQRRKLHQVDISQLLYGQVFTLVVTMITGVYLQQNSAALLLVGTTLVLYPVISDMLSTNAAVLTAGIHHQLDSGQKMPVTKFSFGANLSAVFVTVLTSFLVSVLTALVGQLLFDTSLAHTILLGTIAGTLSAVVGFPIMTLITLFVRSQKQNPDNISAPLDTTIFSSLTIIAIVVVSRIIP